MRSLEQITNEVDFLIAAGLTSRIDTPEKRLAEISRIQANEARAYLNSTDWYVIRFLETANAIPSDITTARAAARLLVT